MFILSLSNVEIINWWQEWVSTLPDGDEKSTLEAEILNGRIFGREVTEQKGGETKINPDLIKVMLCQMGILQLVKK